MRRPQLEGCEVADRVLDRQVVAEEHGRHGGVVQAVVPQLGQVLGAEKEVVVLPAVHHAPLGPEAAEVEVGEDRREENDRECDVEQPPPPGRVALEQVRGGDQEGQHAGHRDLEQCDDERVHSRGG